MPFWTLPPLPGFSLFLFIACGFIFFLGLAAYAIEKRKERKKEKSRKAQAKRWT